MRVMLNVSTSGSDRVVEAAEVLMATEPKRAEGMFREVLRGQPMHIGAMRGMARVAVGCGDFAAAEEWLNRGLAVDPRAGELHLELGRIREGRGDLEEAEKSYRDAARWGGASEGEAMFCLGNILRERARSGGSLWEALALYRRAAKIRPEWPELVCNLAMALHEGGEEKEALAEAQRALTLAPGMAEGHLTRGIVLQKMGRLEEAAGSYARVAELAPGGGLAGQALNNWGNTLAAMEDFEGAEKCLRRGLEILPEAGRIWANLGVVLEEMGKADEGMAAMRKAVEWEPGNWENHYYLGMMLGARGEMAEAWREMEWRWKGPEVAALAALVRDKPMWDGGRLDGKTILLVSEQGFGDAIQFARYVPLVAARGGRVLVEGAEELQRLLESVEGVSGWVIRGEKGAKGGKPGFDVYCPLLSVPAKSGLAEIPARVPYVRAPAEAVGRWRERLKGAVGLRVGLAWSGNTGFRKNRARAMTLAELGPLAGVDGVRFISLQKGEAAEELRHPPAGMRVEDFGAELTDFAETAGLMENLDLVISTDTAVLHLAGALGRPVWGMVSFAPDWRWMRDGEGVPWYPTMRLFRQRERGDWTGVVREIATKLEDLAGKHNRGHEAKGK
jgi:tetratricopeptide (TPR) repeat protein